MSDAEELRARIDALEAELQVQALVTRSIIAISDATLVDFQDDFLGFIADIGRSRFPEGTVARQHLDRVIAAMSKGVL